ncbi:MAG: hypothetical protein BGO68_03010 [Candidatus Amoebophilus sp. 36-38]|nr:MAG: hypothetical protein BGO68_03010 [Candidatus Amoebophilus sp. 36-38]
MAQPALIPSSIELTVGGKEIKILDAQLSLSFTNNSTYNECMNKKGVKDYVLAKGTCVVQSGTTTVTIIKTPDGKGNVTIKELQESLKMAQKSNKPEHYVKDILFVLKNPSNEKFLGIGFSGYASEFTTQAPDSTNYLTYLATIVPFDPLSIDLTK